MRAALSAEAENEVSPTLWQSLPPIPVGHAVAVAPFNRSAQNEVETLLSRPHQPFQASIASKPSTSGKSHGGPKGLGWLSESSPPSARAASTAACKPSAV